MRRWLESAWTGLGPQFLRFLFPTRIESKGMDRDWANGCRIAMVPSLLILTVPVSILIFSFIEAQYLLPTLQMPLHFMLNILIFSLGLMMPHGIPDSERTQTERCSMDFNGSLLISHARPGLLEGSSPTSAPGQLVKGWGWAQRSASRDSLT